MKRTLFVLLLGVGLLYTGTAGAHFNGNSWEEVKGNFLVDIGYDTELFEAGEAIRFEFALKAVATGDPQDFSYVWVRLVDTTDKITIFATGIGRQEVGPTTLLYRFPRAGAYSLDASYRTTEGLELATTSFPLPVTGEQGGRLPLWGIVILTFCAGIGVVFFVYRRMHTPRA